MQISVINQVAGGEPGGGGVAGGGESGAGVPERGKEEKPEEGKEAEKKEKKPGLFDSLMKKSTKKRLKCNSCGKTCSAAAYNKGDKCPHCDEGELEEETIRTPLGHLISFPIYLLAFMGSVFAFFNQLILAIFPYPEFIPLLWFVILLAGVYIAYKLMKMSIGFGILLTVLMVAGLGIGSGFVTGMVLPGGEIENPTLKTIMCILNPSNWNSQALSACQQSVVKPATPQTEKKGGYNVIEVKFGSTFTDPPYTLMSIQGNRTHIFQYVFPISIVNPSEDETVRDFTIINEENWRTRIYNESGTEDGKIADLTPDQCDDQEDQKCNITALGSLSITMDSGGDYFCRRSKTLTVKVSTEYAYSVEGKNEFALVRSQQDLKTVPKIKPTTGAGPVDIAVYFSPEYYVSGSRFKTVYLFITLTNRGKGNAYIKGIEIIQDTTQLPEGTLKLETCRLSTGRSYSDKTIDLSSYPPRLIKEQTNTCKYTITREVTDAQFKTIPFTIKVDYDYVESFTREVDVVRTTMII